MNADPILNQLSDADRKQIDELEISIEQIRTQFQRFIEGFPPIQLRENASLNTGVRRIESPEKESYIAAFETASQFQTICKFVPASGAASRMFRALFAYLADPEISRHPEIISFSERLPDFAFYEDLKASLLASGHKLEELVQEGNHTLILTCLLTEQGLNYGRLPKALLQFHRYEDHTRTATEEHLVEGARYCTSSGDQVRMHFTVSLHHRGLMERHLATVTPRYEKQFQVTFTHEISFQNPATNTIAVDMNNQPFRDKEGKLVFRPGGHGALLENLNHIDADIVFIKNIDNVVPDKLKRPTIEYKKLIGGVLFVYQERIFKYLRRLDLHDQEANLTDLADEIMRFVRQELFTEPPQKILDAGTEERLQYLRSKLNRPIRVCGLIQTEGKTGGGPFHAEGPDGTISLQIVETAQINPDDPQQQALMENSSYANITDLVCGLKDYQGNRFDLLRYRDEEAGFISRKSQNGRDLKALELPGLWNGAMSDWNTLFVEVPLATFNPVKTVMDLLEPAHAGG